jgi:beta-glucanase (GH16 family)
MATLSGFHRLMPSPLRDPRACLFVVALLLGLDPCGRGQETSSSPASNPAGWKLVWDDEFNRPGLPDPAKWNYEVGQRRNHELQYYTQARLENAEVKADGCLHLTARKEPFQNAAYTSASLITLGKFQFTYGRVEIRAKVPGGRGTWPALWMMGTDRGKLPWPLFGEIDLMENVGYEPDRVQFTVHVQKYNWVMKNEKKASIVVPEFSRDFHVYALEWDHEKLRWFFDGKQVFAYDNDGSGPKAWPFDRPAYLLMNLAYGGSWGGKKGVDDSILPAQFLIDYVRIYQKS